MKMDCNNIFRRETLKALGYKEECGGYSHIKYYTKNNNTFVLSDNTDNITLCHNKSDEIKLTVIEFFKKLKEYEI